MISHLQILIPGILGVEWGETTDSFRKEREEQYSGIFAGLTCGDEPGLWANTLHTIGFWLVPPTRRGCVILFIDTLSLIPTCVNSLIHSEWNSNNK